MPPSVAAAFDAARRFLAGQDAATREQVVALVEGLDVSPGCTAASLLPHGLPAGRQAIVPEEVMRDLEVRDAVLPAVCRASTLGGRAALERLLLHPIDDTVTLRARQACARRVARRGEVVSAGVILDEMARIEPHVLCMYAHRGDDSLASLHDMAFFRAWFVRGLNRRPLALTALNLHRIVGSPLVGLLMPVAYVLVPYLIIRMQFRSQMPFRSYLWLMWKSVSAATRALSMPASAQWTRYASMALSAVFYFQSVFTSFEVSATLRRVCRALSDRAHAVVRFFELANELERGAWDDGVAEAWLPGIQPRPQSAGEAPLDAAALRVPPASLGGLLASNFGEHLAAFRAFAHEDRLHALRRAYMLDAVLSIARWREEAGGAWAKYAGGGAPHLRMRGLRHPALPPGTAVPNDWSLGGDAGAPRSVILTGPNAGGKSTLLKAALLAALMAQTLTVAPCSGGCSLTPFSFVNSHINVPDTTGRESLFEAEMRRAKRNIDALDVLGPGRHALVVMDEVFSSTNPVEGIAGAFSVAKRLAACPGALCVISTHFVYLCRLPRETGGLFANYCMPVVEDGDSGGHRCPYRLRRGVSRAYVALDLLRRSGFDSSVVAEAEAVKRRLLGGGGERQQPPADEG